MLKVPAVRRLRSLCALAFVLLCVPTSALALPRFVSPAGVDTGTCDVAASPCLTIAFAIGVSAAGETINLAAGTYSAANIAIPHNLTIAGAGPLTTFIDGAGANRLFSVAGPNVTIRLVTLRNGNAAGANGGAIEVTSGQLTVSGCALTDNDASYGGAIAASSAYAAVSVALSTFSSNNATNSGGAISCEGCATAAVVLGIFNGNSAAVRGGAIYVNVAPLPVAIEASNFTSNTADLGGAIYATTQQLHLSDSNLSLNLADLEGGAVYAGGLLNAQRSAFWDNEAAGPGGAIAMIGNSALSAANDTFSSNSAQAGGAISMSSYGGYGTFAIIGTSTFYDNSCTVANCGGSIQSDASSQFQLYNSIVTAGSTPRCNLPAFDGNHNRINGASCNAAGVANFNLGAITGLNTVLAFNGGLTKTHDLNAGSNAIDAGRNAACLNPFTGAPLVQDQRGSLRPVDYPGVAPATATCDIGAVEKQ